MRGLLVGALSAAAAFATGAAASPQERIVSQNWAGYGIVAPTPAPDATTPATFTSATGTWRQPTVSCTAGRPAFAAVWVGLGGLADDSRALEQIGTEAECTEGGAATYHAWYELVPAAPVRLALKVLPGDTITTSVNVDGTNVLLQIKNRTRRTSFTRLLSMPAPDLSSADWIVEAPARCGAVGRCRTLPLADFGSVAFTRVAAKAGGRPGTISDPSWSARPIELAALPRGASFEVELPGSGGATPSEPSADGRSFTVSWHPATASG